MVRARSGGGVWDAGCGTRPNARLARVGEGMVTCVAPGTTVVTGPPGRTSAARRALNVQVTPATGVKAIITPDRARARQGDVIRFALTVKDAGGQTIQG